MVGQIAGETGKKEKNLLISKGGGKKKKKSFERADGKWASSITLSLLDPK